jgi:hypothetical protein
MRSDGIGTVVGATCHLSFGIGNFVPLGKSTVGVSITAGPNDCSPTRLTTR